MNSIGGYTFKTKDLIETALTHTSFSKNNYERLEFLGDSILDFLVAKVLYKKTNLKESELTRARASLVSEDYLCKIFDALNIKEFVNLGKSCKNITKAIKADIIESIVAVIYLESGINACEKFIKANFDLNANQNKDYKTLFQEYAQSKKIEYSYVLNKTEGPAHALVFYIDLFVAGKKISSASANSKTNAEKKCAKSALEHFKQI